MVLFTSVKPITNEAQNCLDQLFAWLTQCQRNEISVHVAYLYGTGHRTPILIFDDMEIKEKNEEKIN